MKSFYYLLFSLLFCTSVYGQQREHILSFHANIVIDTTGRIEVTEHIKVFVTAVEIKHGIERDIPLYRKDKYGRRVRVQTNILEVQCNAENVTYTTRIEDGNNILRIGDADILLTPGVYEYTIIYESFGQIGFFDDYDELYWNVTGNGWNFIIDEASATVTLPAHVSAIRTDFYTGKRGATEKAGKVEDYGKTQVFKTTRMLDSGEGLTVAVAFPRNIISRPPPPTKAQIFWYEHGLKICGVLGLLIFACYYFFTARKIGKRPRKPIPIPTFKPPRDLSPAEICYLSKRYYTGKALTATFVDIAVKRAMTISCNEKKKYSFINKGDTERLRPVEQQIHSTLFEDNTKEIKVVQKNYSTFSKIQKQLIKSLSVWRLKDFFKESAGYIVVGFLILCALFVSYPFIIINVKTTGLSVALFYGSLFIGYIAYIFRVRMFTLEGAKLASEIEGFRMYMKTAEEHRLNMLAKPEHTLELFEKLLPYAFALGVSNEWCKKFDNVLNSIDYHPDWYDSKDNLRMIGYAVAFSKLATSFNSSVRSANTATGSGSWSSGSSGGGFSGGGGGGGGGRGW
jgi:uncharacterized membrane protein